MYSLNGRMASSKRERIEAPFPADSYKFRASSKMKNPKSVAGIRTTKNKKASVKNEANPSLLTLLWTVSKRGRKTIANTTATNSAPKYGLNMKKDTAVAAATRRKKKLSSTLRDAGMGKYRE